MANFTDVSQSLDPILTGLFYEKVQSAQDFKGLIGAPPVAIDGITGQYLALADRPRLSLDQSDDAYGAQQLEPLGLHDTSLPVGASFETRTVSLERYARNFLVEDREARQFNASSGFDLRDPAITYLAHKILAVHAHKTFVGGYSVDTNYGDGSGSGAGSHVVDGPDLNTTSNTIADEILTGRQEIYDATGRYPNHVFVNPLVANALRLNDSVRNRPNQGGSDNTLATSDALAAFFQQMFGLNLVIVPATFTAADGTVARFMGDHIAMSFLDSSTTAPTYACTFVEQGTNTTGDGATLAGIREERIEDPQANKIIADVMYKVQIENKEAGYLIKDVLS
jgi:hypothetical protein